MSITDPNKTILTGENPFLRLSSAAGGEITTNASFWRIYLSPMGPGHVLYLKSELTGGQWQIYSDNISMTRWLQDTVQGMLNPELADKDIAVLDAAFEREGDPRTFWTEHVTTPTQDISLTWYDIGEPLMLHHQPGHNGRKYGLNTVLIPALGGRLIVDGEVAAGKPWPVDREGRPFSTSALAFSESWTEPRG
jgi:hypothetical protein